MAAHDSGMPAFAYSSNISGLGSALAVASTLEFGDIPIPRGYRQALASEWADYWREAIAAELNGLMKNETWDVIPESDMPAGSNLMNCHMVFTVKRLSDGSIEKFKCRLVANGNTQRHGVDFDRIFSTVVKISTIRVVLAIAAAYDYNLTSVDVKQAYLQATLSEDLYMRMPPGLPSYDKDGRRLVVKLRKSLYGLRQAGREWGQLLTSFLVSYGFRQSSIDVCLYTLTRGDRFIWLLVWVDDCVIVDNDMSLRASFVAALNTRFPLTDSGELEWILGVKVTRDRPARRLVLSQALYVTDLLKRFSHVHENVSKSYTSPVGDKCTLAPEQSPALGSAEHKAMRAHHDDYMSLAGAYLWLSNVSRPELSFISLQLARFVSNPGKPHLDAAVRVLVYLRGSVQRTLVFRPDVTVPLRIYVDSDWAVKFSISGAIFTFMGCPVHWFAKTQRSVSMSSTEAEFFAAMMAARDGVHLRDLLADLSLLASEPTVIRSDNKSVADLALDAIAFKKTKHIMRAAEFLRDLCMRRVFAVVWISGLDNVADLFTKGHSAAVFASYMALLDGSRRQ